MDFVLGRKVTGRKTVELGHIPEAAQADIGAINGSDRDGVTRELMCDWNPVKLDSGAQLHIRKKSTSS